MGLLDLIYPKTCLGCGKGGGYACEACKKKIRRHSLFCPECKEYSFLGKTHFGCQKPLGLDGLLVVWRYEGLPKKLLWRMKYRFAYDLGEFVAGMASSELANIKHDWENQVLLPVPLHNTRKRWRGFNQSEILGEKIASSLGLDYEKEMVLRQTAGKTQVGLSKEERVRNISGKFAVKSYVLDKYDNKTLLVFDDVWTTGATINEICRVLKRSGAENVWGLVLAGG